MSTTSDLAIPDKTSFDACQRYLRAFYVAKAHEKPVKIQDVAEIVGISPTSISRNNRFFEAAGFITKEGDGIKLREQSVKFLESLDWELEAESRYYLRKVLEDYELTQKAISYLSVKEEVTIDDLIKRIAIFVGKPSDPRWITGAKAFIDFLFYAEILTEREGKLSYSRPTSLKTAEKVSEAPNQIEPSIEEKEAIKKRYPVDLEPISLQIQISISSSTSDEEIIRVMKAIRRGITEPIEDSGDEDGNEASKAS